MMPLGAGARLDEELLVERLASASAASRARMSVAPPAAKVLTMRTDAPAARRCGRERRRGAEIISAKNADCRFTASQPTASTGVRLRPA
jgi:hypothetical protein